MLKEIPQSISDFTISFKLIMSNPSGNILRLTANESLIEGNLNATIVGIEGVLVEED